MKQFMFSLVLSIIVMPAFSQPTRSAILQYDPYNGYSYYKQIDVAGAKKAVLYGKVKNWVKTSLNASDNYKLMDETNNDSIRTVAFLLLPDIPQMQNQTIDYKVLIKFQDGGVTIHATSFIFHGTNKLSGDVYDDDLADIKDLQEPTNQIIVYAFDKKFGELMRILEMIVR